MHKKLTSTFIVALMLASCFVSVAAVTEPQEAEEPILVTANPGDEFAVGDTIATKAQYDLDKVFEEINELIHKNGQAAVMKLYELVADSMEEKMSFNEFKEQALKLLDMASSIGMISKNSAAFLKGLIENPEEVNLDYETSVDLIKDLCIVVSLVASVITGEDYEIELEEFSYDISGTVITEVSRLSTYQYQFAEYSDIIISVDLVAYVNGDKYIIEDGVFSIGVMASAWIQAAPKDLTYSFGVHAGFGFTGNSNFINSNAEVYEDLIAFGESMNPFDINLGVGLHYVQSTYPAYDFPFYGDKDSSSFGSVASVEVDLSSTTPLIKADLEDIDISITTPTFETPVDVSRTTDGGYVLKNKDLGLIVQMLKGGFAFLEDTDNYMINLITDGSDLFVFAVEVTDEIDTYAFSIVYVSGEMRISVNDEPVTVIDVSEILDPEYYYGEDLVLTDDEVEMLNEEMRGYATLLGCDYVWKDIVIGDVVSVNFYVSGINGPIQSERIVAGNTASTPGKFISYDGSIICGWATSDGVDYKATEPVTRNMTYHALQSSNLLDDAPEVGEMVSGETYVLLVNSDTVVDGDAMTPGAILMATDKLHSYSWHLCALEEDDLTESTLNLFVEQVFDYEGYAEDVIGERNAVFLDFHASGVMPAVSFVEYGVGLNFAEGQNVDVYYDDGEKLVLIETCTVTDGTVIFDVPHCSTYILAEHVDAPSDMTLIIVGIIVLLVIIVAIAFFLKKKKTC